LRPGLIFDLSWDASTDNVGVTGYHIYRDGGGTPIATVTTGTTYQDETGLNPLTEYTYTVSAIDAASNESAQSSQASTTTIGTLTTIDTGNTWKYFKGTSDPAAGWTGVSFDDSAWLSGATGIGFGDFDDATELTDMQNSYTTVYARKTFTVSDASEVAGMRLNMDYDDGFVSYINGQEVTRANMPAGAPGRNTAASGNHEASKAGAFESFDLDAYTGNLVTGTNVLTVEIHNSAVNDKDLSMIPELDIDNKPAPDVTAPSIPANLAATAVSMTQIDLSWDASTDNVAVTGYNIYRDGGGIPIATIAGTTYQDTGLNTSTFYTYNVSAVDASSNESAQSSQASDTTLADSTPPSTPANLTATTVSKSQIDLSWDVSTDNIGVTGYKIYRDGGGTPIATVTTGTTYQDTGLSAETLYTYNVSAVDAESNESAQPPSTPANLTATAVYTSENINRGDTWKYFKGTSNPGAGWDDVSFDDSAWLSGASGIGFGDGDDATDLTDMQNSYRTVYARKTFNVSDASVMTVMSLRIAYDDLSG